MEMKLCPLRKHTQKAEKETMESFGVCEGENCAWWYNQGSPSKCAILEIAEDLDILQDKTPRERIY